MEWTMLCYDGTEYTLPTPVAWRLNYGLGTPCDSVWVKTLWSAGQESRLADGTRLRVTEKGETLFFGVIDECETQWSPAGCVAEITGRGLQALLLDNQAEAADYGQATLAEILRRYVTPYGIGLEKAVSLPAVQGFSVASGSSCWKVLYTFARYYAGVTPRFTRSGQPHQVPWPGGKGQRHRHFYDQPLRRLARGPGAADPNGMEREWNVSGAREPGLPGGAGA